MANNIQTITRTAAMMHADEQSGRTIKSVKRTFIDAVFVNGDNSPKTIDEIVTILQEKFELVFLEKDVAEIVCDDRYYVLLLGKSKQYNAYYLPNDRYIKLKERSEYCIDNAIEEYIENKEDVEKEQIKNLLNKYLYELLNTNIGAFSQLLERKGAALSSVIDSSTFEDSEIDIINGFLTHENPRKDRALFELINYCIEYASAFNCVDPKTIISALKNKRLYLDNSLIFRALGINGPTRKQRVENLLQRCNMTGQQLFISSITRKEFFDSIDYHINQIKGTTPYGSINAQLFRRYTGGHSIYQYYHEWRRNRTSYGYETFRIHIKNEFDALLKRFGIQEDFSKKYNERDDHPKIDQYFEEIKVYKGNKNPGLIENDAKNVLWVERAREGCDYNIRDTKYYFLTSDRKLQSWDLSHSKNQPITMLPSQWLALLLKYFSQSNNDYKSFVSFLSIPKEDNQISPEDLQVALASISEITEDYQKQEDIVSELLEVHETWNIRNREDVKRFAKEKIEADYLEKIKSIEESSQNKLNEQKVISNQQLLKKQEELEKLIQIHDEERRKDKIERLKEKIDNCKIQLKDKKTILKQINQTCNRKRNIFITFAIILYVAYIIALGVLIFIVYDWNVMEPFTYLSGLIMTFIPFVYSLCNQKNLEFWKIPSTYREGCYIKLCKKNAIEESEIDDLTDTIKSLEREKEILEGKKTELTMSFE